jgi:hypothetical protein
MKAHYFSLIMAALCLALSSDRAEAWGFEGHAAIGQAAVMRLSPRTRARVQDILGADSPAELANALAEACFWPDTVRDEPEWAWSAPLHYVNLPRGAVRYDRERDCPQGLCVTEAIPKYAGELDSAEFEGVRLKGDRRQAWQSFAWLCHLVGDVHQPLHAGFGDDRGANEVDVEYQGERLNLHRFWDGALADDRLAADGSWQQASSPQDSACGPPVWARERAICWTEESHALASAVAYPPTAVITDTFAEASWAVVRKQWSKAAQRLALVLEAVLDQQAVKPGSATRSAPGIAQRSRAMRNPIRASWRSGNAEMRKAEREWSGELAQ